MSAATRGATPSGWRLSQPAFERLLAALGDDRESAGDEYERIRGRLAKLFAWRGCAEPEDLADRTLDRVARRLEEGAELRIDDPYGYVHGVALRVLHEYWRDPAQKRMPLPDLVADTPAESVEARAAGEDRRLDCLDRCLAVLPEKSRRLLERYHGGDPKDRIRSRQELATALGIAPNALRIRAHRLRAALQDCIVRCEASGAPAKRMPSGRISERGTID